MQEHAGYLAVPGAHVYTVLHQVQDPVARVLLAGSARGNEYPKGTVEKLI